MSLEALVLFKCLIYYHSQFICCHFSTSHLLRLFLTFILQGRIVTLLYVVRPLFFIIIELAFARYSDGIETNFVLIASLRWIIDFSINGIRARQQWPLNQQVRRRSALCWQKVAALHLLKRELLLIQMNTVQSVFCVKWNLRRLSRPTLSRGRANPFRWQVLHQHGRGTAHRYLIAHRNLIIFWNGGNIHGLVLILNNCALVV